MCKCSETTVGGRVDYQYAVKIVCGTIDKQAKDQPLPLGNYKTKINIHNFSRCECVTFRWKVAVGFTHLKVGPVSDFSDATLCADEALEIDYHDILRRVGRDITGHIEGWVVIESPTELDVVAVYGTAASADGTVNAFHTERVAARCLPVCDDFSLDVSTGVSAWEVKSPENGAVFNIATLGQKNPGWADAQPGSLWVRPGTDTADGDYTYKLEFKLCSGFRNPVLDMHLLADNTIMNVSLNGHTILASQAPSNNNFNIPPIQCTANSFFKTGKNVLTITVNNQGMDTGLNVHGSLEVAHGLCAGEPMPLLCCPNIEYNAYLQKFPWESSSAGGWQGWRHDGETAGTTGENRRMEKVKIQLTGCIPPGMGIAYTVRSAPLVGGAQWLETVTNGEETGHLHWRMELVKVDLVNAPINCHLCYRVYMRHNGWGPWVTEGNEAGSSGHNRRIEAIEMKFC